MGENYKPNVAYRGNPVPPEEVNLEKIVNILCKDGEISEERRKVAEWKWKNPFTI